MKTRIALFALAVGGVVLAVGERPVAARRQNPWEIIKKKAKEVKEQVEAAKPKKGEAKRPTATPDGGAQPGGQPDAAGGGAAGPVSSARVESEVLLTAEPGLQYVLSPKGQHVAAVRMSGSREVLVYDGVDGPKFDEVLKSNGRPAVAFSPDGSRYAYGFGDITGARVQAMVDGAPHAGAILAPAISSPKRFAFSPDNKHIVYAAYTPDGRARGISLNGKFIPISQLPVNPFANPTFTPDGRHLLWVTGFNGTRSAVYVDGLRAVEFGHDGIALTQSTSDMPLEVHWSMGSDGVLTFVAQDGGSLKRFRITPPDDTSVETLARMSAIR